VFDDRTESIEQDLTAVVEEAVAAAREEFPAATFELHPSPSQRVVAHPRLAIAVEELLGNAVVHQADRDPNVTVSFDREGDEAVVRITDDGPGIPEIERAVLEDGVEDALTHSRGIGLWVVRFIVTASGGSLSVPLTNSDGQWSRSGCQWRERERWSGRERWSDTPSGSRVRVEERHVRENPAPCQWRPSHRGRRTGSTSRFRGKGFVGTCRTGSRTPSRRLRPPMARR